MFLKYMYKTGVIVMFCCSFDTSWTS